MRQPVKPVKPLKGRRLRVFVVEDSALTVENLSALLEQLCNAVVVGSAGDEASAMERIRCELASGELDLLIVDVFLRDGTGLGVLAQLAQRDCRVPRVMLSNYAKPEIKQACLALGADRFFDKSTDVDELVDYCHTIHTRVRA